MVAPVSVRATSSDPETHCHIEEHFRWSTSIYGVYSQKNKPTSRQVSLSNKELQVACSCPEFMVCSPQFIQNLIVCEYV